jgi:hypothetical protein
MLTRGYGGRESSKEEERVNCLVPSSTNVAGGLKQLNLNTQAQSVCSRFEVSDVISIRVALVMTLRSLCSEVVVSPACKMTTTSMLRATGCVDVDAQSLLVTSTSALRRERQSCC